jgi:hypothetical protein
MSDHDAIRKLYAEFCYLMDDRDDRLVTLFTEDCWLPSRAHDGAGRRGRGGVRELLELLRATHEPDDVRHVITNLDIDVDGKTATTMATVLSFYRGSERPYLRRIGRYQGELVLEDRWRLRVHRVIDTPAWDGPPKPI